MIANCIHLIPEITGFEIEYPVLPDLVELNKDSDIF